MRNLFLTFGLRVRNKLLWALRYANVSLTCRHLSWISRLHTKAPDIKTTTVVDRSRSAMCWYCAFHRSHRTIVFMWTLNIQIRAMANFDRRLWTFEAFWLVHAMNTTKRSAVALRLGSRFCRESDDSLDNKTPKNLMVFSEISLWNAMFLCSIKTEMFTVAEW